MTTRLFQSTRPRVSKKSGIILFAVIAGCVGLAFGVRWFIRARTESARYSCITALKAIDGAKQTWALELHKTTNDVPTWDDLAKLNGWVGWRWECPNGGVYTIGDPPTCSIGGPSHSLP
jgi:hypothetical protein